MVKNDTSTPVVPAHPCLNWGIHLVPGRSSSALSPPGEVTLLGASVTQLLRPLRPWQHRSFLSRERIPSPGKGSPSPGRGSHVQGEDALSRERIPMSRERIPSPEKGSHLQGEDPPSRERIPSPGRRSPLQGEDPHVQGEDPIFRGGSHFQGRIP